VRPPFDPKDILEGTLPEGTTSIAKLLSACAYYSSQNDKERSITMAMIFWNLCDRVQIEAMN
jgi:hypothetical protein